MLRNNGLLIVLSGPSGSGKGTVLKELLEQNDNLALSISATTRSPRKNEVDGYHYHFLSMEGFQQKIKQQDLLEYAKYCGNYYGTLKSEVEKSLEFGKHIVLEIEVQGAMQVLSSMPEAVSIFIMPPSAEELKKRLVGRQTESQAAIDRRLAISIEEMKVASTYDYVVVNHDVSDTIQKIDCIIRAEQCRGSRMNTFIEEVLLNA